MFFSSRRLWRGDRLLSGSCCAGLRAGEEGGKAVQKFGDLSHLKTMKIINLIRFMVEIRAKTVLYIVLGNAPAVFSKNPVIFALFGVFFPTSLALLANPIARQGFYIFKWFQVDLIIENNYGKIITRM